MKLLCYADVHATDGDELCFNHPNTTLQHYRFSRFFADLVRIYASSSCKGIIDLGDTTSDRSSIPLHTLETVGTGLASLPDGEHYKLTGNHEQYLRDTTVNNRRLFEHKFHVISGRETFMMGDRVAFFVSYPEDHGELAAWLTHEMARFRKHPKILFGHFQVQGSFYQSGQAMTGIPAELLKPFDLVMLGHIHLPQSITPKIHYVGSPFQQDWGESGQTKRVGIVDTDSLTVDWIPLKGYPEYLTVPLNEFKTLSVDNSENRYRVVLGSHEETEEFFKHPLFHRAVAEYSYNDMPAVLAEDSNDWSFAGICRQYMKTVPPSKVGIEVSDDMMIEFADYIIKR